MNTSVLNIAKYYVNFSVFLFLVLSVAFQGSYAISGAVLVSSYVFLFSAQVREKIALTNIEKGLIAVLIMYLVSNILEVVFYDVAISKIDPQSKILAFIPLIFVLNAVKINVLTTILGLGVGALGLFILAIYEKYYLGLGRVGLNINAIQLGNIALAFGLLTIVLSPIIYAVKLHSESILKKRCKLAALICVILGFLSIIASILTLTRGGLVFVPILLVVVSFYYLAQIKHYFKQLLILTVLAGAVIALVIPSTSIVSRVEVAIKNVESYFVEGNATTSSGIRLELWKAAAIITMDNPVLGIGEKQYMKEKKKLIEQGQIDPIVLNFGHSHNAYFYAAVRRGGVGLLILLALLFYPVLVAHQEIKHHIKSSHPQAVKAPAVALLVFGLFFIFANLTQTLFAHNSGMIMYTGILIILTSLMLAVREKEFIQTLYIKH
ncbi:MAG: O-antigen ligase family protein [Oceanospirillaceae bacterium]